MTISILIPVLNEEKFLRRCLESIRSFIVPQVWKITEILILDGGSSDNTKAIILDMMRTDPRIRLCDNPGVIQSCAMNIGIRQASGDWIMRMDAHSIYPQNYLFLCAETVRNVNADNVGGVFITMPGNEKYSAAIVQALTTHKFGVGDSGFRLGQGPGKADTVPYGFFRRELFSKMGFFDERLVRGQDYELNRRIASAGGIIWRNPEIRIFYHNQPSLWAFLKKQVIREAPYNAYMWYLAPHAFALRHAITGFFALGIISGLLLWHWSLIRLIYVFVLGLYAVLATVSSFQQGIKYRQWRHVFVLPLCFFSYHFTHGIGLLVGLLKLLTLTASVQKIKEPWQMAGQFRAWPPPDGVSWNTAIKTNTHIP